MNRDGKNRHLAKNHDTMTQQLIFVKPERLTLKIISVSSEHNYISYSDEISEITELTGQITGVSLHMKIFNVNALELQYIGFLTSSEHPRIRNRVVNITIISDGLSDL